MIGGQHIVNTIGVDSVPQTAQRGSIKTIPAECLRQEYFNNDVFSAEIIRQNMMTLYNASLNTYNGSTVRGAASIEEIIADG